MHNAVSGVQGLSNPPTPAVCNHVSTLDDPTLVSTMFPWEFFLTEHKHGNVRWTLGAKELLYRNRIFSDFFR